MMEIKTKTGIAIFALVIIVIAFGFIHGRFAFAQTGSGEQNPGGGEVVNKLEATVCCGKTNSGLFCQDVPEEECAENPIPTACSSTAQCQPGWCLDDIEGTCLDGVAQSVCSNEEGQWFAEKPPVCDLGCCLLGDQASYVTLPRCKALSSQYGIETKWDDSIEGTDACILTAAAREKGACIFVQDFARTCKITTLGECTVENMLGTGGTAQQPSEQNAGDLGLVETEENSSQEPENGGNNGGGSNQSNEGASITGQVVSGLEEGKVEFFPGKLCSAPELQTICGPTKQTTCVDGKQEVYFVDSCGNPANIYDTNKINDVGYWTDMKSKEEGCNPTESNENSQICGNCNYLGGTYCREKGSETATPTYGDFVCASLNCIDPVSGKKRLHGESWCGFDNPALKDIGRNPVGSKFFRYLCNNGEVVIEPCAEFRQEECIANSLETSFGQFSEAACRVNKWQDCTTQRNSEECLNTDRRDCLWLDGIEYVLMGAVLQDENGSSALTKDGGLAGVKERAKQAVKEAGGIKNIPRGACVPKNPPGLKFWEGEEALNICSQANAVCPVTYEKRKFGGGEWECIENCECLAKSTEVKRAQLCVAMGDCGLNVNILGQVGNNKGYKITTQDLDGD